jgi:hypothetical protein
MKKMLLALLMLSAGAAKAYTLKVINSTNLTINVDADYAGGGVCSHDFFQLRPGEKREKGVGLCCLSNVKVTAPKVGLTQQVKGRLTGYGISCRSNTFIVRYDPSAGLVVEHYE